MNLYDIYLNENFKIKKSKTFLIGNKYIKVLLIQTIYTSPSITNRFKVILEINNINITIHETNNDDKNNYEEAISVYRRIKYYNKYD